MYYMEAKGMNKREFLAELRKYLWRLPVDEMEAALTYYEEFIEDAGPENELATIAKLGTPKQVAENIFQEFNTNVANSEAGQENTKTEAENKDGSAGNYYYQQDSTRENNYKDNHYTKDSNYSSDYKYSTNHNYSRDYNSINQKKKNTILWIILIVLASPLILGLGGGLFGVIVGVLGAIFGIGVALFASVIGLVVGGIGLLISGITSMFVSTWVGLMLVGTGLVLLGLGLLLAVPTMLLFSKWLPQLFRWIIKGVKKLFSKHRFQTI